MSSRLAAAVGTWKVRGVGGLGALARSKLYWHGRFVRFHVDLRTWQINGPLGGPGIEARRGSLAELAVFRTATPGLPNQFYVDQTHRVQRCYLGLVDGCIGHISWVFTSADRPRQMRLGPDEIMLDGAYTQPEWRGRGLLSAVERAILDDATREGVRHAYTHVAHDNVASLRGVAKTGFRPVGVLDWRWVLGVAILRYDESLVQLAADTLIRL